MPKLILKTARAQIWAVGNEFYVYGITASGDPRVCPSIGMAREVAAGA